MSGSEIVLLVRVARAATMTDNHNHKELPTPQVQDLQRRCPTCSTPVRLTHTILDSRRSKTVHLYTCQCGERVWDD
jgi:predicted SprT family Zn-dependent metalloprotease